MSARSSQRGTVVPVRDMDREKASSGSGEVKSWMMSPEELEDYRARTGYKAPTNVEGKIITPPVQQKQANLFSSEEQSRRAKSGRKESDGPDKKAFLKSIADGHTVASTEKAFGMKANGLYYWVKKWELVGITPGKARSILNGETITNEVENLKAKNILPMPEAAVIAIKELNDRISDYEGELARWAQIDTENVIRLTEVTEDRDQWQQQSNIYKKMSDTYELERNEALQAVAEMEEEKRLLLSVIEEAASHDPAFTLVKNDNVNHPAHYNAGGIECIDAIEAALTGLTGGQAYGTGAAIKYLWRWSRKNGVEDLEKAAWYVNRLIGEAKFREG